jgi:hypothetical protein
MLEKQYIHKYINRSHSNLKVITGDKELNYLKAIQTQKGGGGGVKKKDNLLRSFNLKTMR